MNAYLTESPAAAPADPKTATAAVLMATAIDDLRVADSALKAGAYGYLVKPFEANQLLVNVAGVLDRRRLEREGQQQRKELKRSATSRTVQVEEATERGSQSAGAVQVTQEEYACPVGNAVLDDVGRVTK